MIKRFFLGNQKGTVLVLLVLAMSALAGFTALVTDTGAVYLQRMRLSNALDSAVLAGIQELPDNTQGALEMAAAYAQQNGGNVSEFSFTVDTDNNSISGHANRQIGLFFARALGFNSTIVQAEASARLAPITSTGGVVPFGVLEDDFTFGEETVMKEGIGDGPYRGWFGALRLGGNGAHVYRDNIKYGYPGEVSIGDVIPIEPGNMSGPTRVGIDYRIGQCNHYPRCTIYSYVNGCPRILIVPIVNVQDITSEGHPDSVRVVGFAAFLVQDCVGNGNENYVRGYFIRYVIPGSTGDSGADYGLYGAQLYE
ncbi:MAG: Tad domain-containing protein [Bacillota bacterium]|nr:Tad domain-containing protein [Bacillota bacterium]